MPDVSDLLDVIIEYSDKKYNYVVLKQNIALNKNEICSFEIKEEDACGRAINENDGHREAMYYFYYMPLIDETYIDPITQKEKTRRVMKGAIDHEQT